MRRLAPAGGRPPASRGGCTASKGVSGVFQGVFPPARPRSALSRPPPRNEPIASPPVHACPLASSYKTNPFVLQGCVRGFPGVSQGVFEGCFRGVLTPFPPPRAPSRPCGVQNEPIASIPVYLCPLNGDKTNPFPLAAANCQPIQQNEPISAPQLTRTASCLPRGRR